MECIKPLHLLKPARIVTDSFFFNFTKNGISSFPLAIKPKHSTAQRSYSVNSSVLEPPDIPRLAKKARISLTPQEVEKFAPKIRQVIDWFGQLQAVDLESIEPAIRADTEGYNLRDDIPEKFENREALIFAVPSFEEPYIKVPKVLNKELHYLGHFISLPGEDHNCIYFDQ